MTRKTVNADPRALQAPPARPGTRYSTVARLLTAEIDSGKYRVGQRFPTEEQLCERFDVSRHTVREALRELKTQGLLVAHAGIGTTVRAKAPVARYMQSLGSLQEVIQFVEATRMSTFRLREVVADEALAQRVGGKPGQLWHEAAVLRLLPGEPLPVAALSIYVRPEYADVLSLIDKSKQPVFSLIERRHGVKIAEVRQQIIAVNLAAAIARRLKARAGAPALEITRQYRDAQDRIAMASVGLYPSDRFSHNATFRIQQGDTPRNPTP